MRLPIIMCVYRRVNRLEKTIHMLNAQRDSDYEFVVWNNSSVPNEGLCERLRPLGAPWRVLGGDGNRGGAARFSAATLLLMEGHERVAMIDDDQSFGPRLVEQMKRAARANTIAGWYSWRFVRDGHGYFARTRVEEPRALADYVGTGGLVADSAIFGTGIVHHCPYRWKFGIEDLWLSYCASIVGWRLEHAAVDIEIERDGLDTFASVRNKKIDAFATLRKMGWAV